METELTLGEGLFEGVNELATKDPSQDLARKKEAGMGSDPAGVVGGKPSGRNDAMDMGMGTGGESFLPPTATRGSVGIGSHGRGRWAGRNGRSACHSAGRRR